MQCELVLVVALYVGMVHSWDFATTTGNDQLHFFTDETLTSTIKIESQNLSALTYDEVHNMMLYVNKQTNNDTICGYDLNSMENICFNHESGRNIHGLAFDPVTELVFFTDTNERSVNWISLIPGAKDTIYGNLLIKVDEGIPRDIVVDSCERYIYWLNTNITKPTIERARLSDIKREVFQTLTTIPVNETFKLEPYGLAIDQPVRSIYWLGPAKNNANTNEYRLFTSTLNEKKTMFVFHIFNPNFINAPTNTLTVSNNSIIVLKYAFKEKCVLTITKSPYANYKRSVYSDKNMPISLVANYKIKDQIKNCETGRVKFATKYDVPFCVHGTKVSEDSICKCTRGYTGERCDVFLCENYCSQGNCSLSDEGLPECRCNAGYFGERCDVSLCENYCSQGNCSFNDEGLPECRCNAGYFGERCDVSLCKNYCLQGNCSSNDEGLPECRCNAGYSGERCQYDACCGYCLNNGNCFLDEEDEPACECIEGYEGTRCEADEDFNDTITILVSHRNKTSTLVVP